jgi:hypothetical protein
LYSRVVRLWKICTTRVCWLVCCGDWVCCRIECVGDTLRVTADEESDVTTLVTGAAVDVGTTGAGRKCDTGTTTPPVALTISSPSVVNPAQPVHTALQQTRRKPDCDTCGEWHTLWREFDANCDRKRCNTEAGSGQFQQRLLQPFVIRWELHTSQGTQQPLA